MGFGKIKSRRDLGSLAVAAFEQCFVGKDRVAIELFCLNDYVFLRFLQFVNILFFTCNGLSVKWVHRSVKNGVFDRLGHCGFLCCLKPSNDLNCGVLKRYCFFWIFLSLLKQIEYPFGLLLFVSI